MVTLSLETQLHPAAMADVDGRAAFRAFTKAFCERANVNLFRVLRGSGFDASALFVNFGAALAKDLGV